MWGSGSGIYLDELLDSSQVSLRAQDLRCGGRGLEIKVEDVVFRVQD